MFGELFKDIKDTISTARHGTPTTTLTFAKPYCSPARGIIEPVLAKYGVKVFRYQEAPRMTNPLTVLALTSKIASGSGYRIPNALPIAQVVTVTVSEAAAAWAEYLLMRTGKLYRTGGYINRRNQQWAAQHGGEMPPAWDEGKPWIEKSCTEGMKAWQEVKQATRKGKKR